MVGRRRDPESGRDELRALTVLTFEGELIAAITAFLGPGVLARLRGRGLRHRPMSSAPEAALNQ